MIRNVTCKTTPVSRGKGHSAIAGAAYRAGENIKARGQAVDGGDKWFRYSNRALTVRDAFILTPEGAPDYADDRAELWNRVEEMETHKNARLGREVQLGLAYELSHEEQKALVTEFAQREFIAKGFVADVAIHNYGRTLPAMGGSEAQVERIRELAEAGIPFLERAEAEGMSDVHMVTLRNSNDDVTGYKLYQPHAHIRVVPRVSEDGEFVKDKAASRELNKHETAMRWRYEYPALQNAYLERAGSEVRVSSTSADEDAFPDVRFLGSSRTNQTHNIEERAELMNDAQKTAHEEAKSANEHDKIFRDMHNETVKETFLDLESSGSHEEVEQTRVALWWHNTTRRFQEWRHDFKDTAAEWVERFELKKEHIRNVISWYDPPPKEQDPDTHLDQEPAQDPAPPKEEEPQR